MFPNLFLIGAPKAGTTFLFNAFQSVPDVFCPERKEPAYFLIFGRRGIADRGRMVRPLADSRDPHAYQSLFSAARTYRYRLDASTHYLSSPETAKRIAEATSDSRVIAVLREPVSRAYSHYLMGVRDGFIRESFDEALAIELDQMSQPDVLWSEHYRMIRRSLYLEGLRAFASQFDRLRMRVYCFEDIVSSPEWVLQDVGEFLEVGVDTALTSMSTAGRNSFAVDRFPQITTAFHRYRQSPVRTAVNTATPRRVRDEVRRAYDRARLRQDIKPTMSPTAESLLRERLGDDYEQAVAFCERERLLATRCGVAR